MVESSVVKFEEVGKSGNSQWGSLIRSILESDFTWPECWEEFDKIRRTNPEVSVVRMLYTSTAREVDLKYEPPEDATPEDEEFTDFLNSCLADIDLEAFKETLITQVPFMGWGLWEIVPGLRTEGWVAPDGKLWESFNTDGLIGIRKLAWRDQSTLEEWMRDDTGQPSAMVQRVWPDPKIELDLSYCLHLIYGDQTVPTGLSPFQAVARLRRIKHALEIVQGMGFEHSAGHVKFTVKAKMTEDATAQMAAAAKAIMTAAQGSYATAIEDQYDFTLEDVPFAAAADILKSISYYGMVILQIFAAHFIAVATTSGTGSYAATSDHSAIYLTAFNAIMSGFSKQTGRQLASYLRKANGDRFKNITAYPELQSSEVKKVIPLADLAAFLKAFSAVLPINDEDARAIRDQSKILPADQPTNAEDIGKAQSKGFGNQPDESDDEPDDEAEEDESLSLENVKPKGSAIITATPANAFITEKEIAKAIDVFNAFCDENYPEFKGMLEAKVKNANKD